MRTGDVERQGSRVAGALVHLGGEEDCRGCCPLAIACECVYLTLFTSIPLSILVVFPIARGSASLPQVEPVGSLYKQVSAVAQPMAAWVGSLLGGCFISSIVYGTGVASPRLLWAFWLLAVQ